MFKAMFKFADLSDAAKAKAIESHRYDLVDDDFWSACTIEMFKENLESKGFRDVEISFSGFSSQGDGASFTSGVINVEEFLRSQGCYSKYRRYVPNNNYNDITYSLKVTRFHGCRYVHENSVFVDESWGYTSTENQENKIREIVEMISEFVKDESREIYKALECDYDGHTTDEAIAEHLTINEYEFTEDGEMI